MNQLEHIRKPIEDEFKEFVSLFNQALSHSDALLANTLDHIKKRGGKRMRPILTLLYDDYSECRHRT